MRTPTANILATAFLCALSGIASRAMATEATVEGVSINLPAPAGFCELTKSNSPDKRAIDVMERLVGGSGNRLLGITADCQQLADWRVGKRLLADYGQYQTPLAESAATDQLLKQKCASLRTQGEQIFSSIKDEMKSKMEEGVKQLRVNEQSFVGFLGEDPTACYIAILQKLSPPGGTEATQLTLHAETIVKGRFLYVNRYARYVNSDTVKDTLEKLKSTVAALLAANRT